MMPTVLLAFLLAAAPASIASSTEKEVSSLAGEAPKSNATPSRAEYLSCISKMQSVASDHLMDSVSKRPSAKMVSRRIEVLECVKELDQRTPASAEKTKLSEVFELYVTHMDSPSSVSLVELATSMGEFMAMVRNNNDR